MNFNIVLDISSIIWDREDYNKNKNEYYNLQLYISILLEKFEKEKPKILLREELKNEMTDKFPFNELPENFYEFGNLVYSFLGNSSFILYENHVNNSIISIPNLKKEYYSEEIKQEINYLISKIHSDNETRHIYFTFQYLWNKNNVLKTKTDENSKEYKTIISDKDHNLNDFFENLKPKFEHNKKHNCHHNRTREAWENTENKKNFISELSCYRTKNDKKVQKILDKSIKYKSTYIGYDSENEVWVIFRNHTDNMYHAYDEYDCDNIDKIPLSIKSKFNK